MLICVLGMVGGAIEICLSEKGALAKKRLRNTVIEPSQSNQPLEQHENYRANSNKNDMNFVTNVENHTNTLISVKDERHLLNFCRNMPSVCNLEMFESFVQ